MCFIISFGPATAWVVIGYFVLFVSTKADGSLQTFGKVLAVWMFIVAAMIPIMGAYITLSGLCPLDQIMR